MTKEEREVQMRIGEGNKVVGVDCFGCCPRYSPESFVEERKVVGRKKKLKKQNGGGEGWKTWN